MIKVTHTLLPIIQLIWGCKIALQLHHVQSDNATQYQARGLVVQCGPPGQGVWWQAPIIFCIR